MTNAEYIKTIPTLTNKELLEELDYCGYDSYYRTIREPVIEEITKRLNRIAELEKENAELKEKLKTAYRKGMRHMAKALKDYDRTDGAWTDYFEHTVDKVLQREQLEFEEYGTLADQLTKAKELLAKWVELYKPKLEGYPITPIQEQTEQFISEVEK